MTTPLLTLKDIDLHFGAKDIFHHLSLSIHAHDAMALVGRNGCGKSTLLKILMGHMQPDEGQVFLQPGVTLSYCPQETDFGDHKTLRAYCIGGLLPHQQYEDYRMDALVSDMSLDMDKHPQEASGGERRRAALVRAFISHPDILLLDEPTNHLDLEGILWLEKQLKAFKGALVLISHDRRFLTHVSKVTLWLDRGHVRRLNKGYEHFEAWAEQLLEHERNEQQKQAKLIDNETRWSHQGISARRKRNQGRLRRLYDLRAQKANHIGEIGRAKLTLQEGEMSGQLVIEAKKISKALGHKVLFNNFSTRILSGDRIGIVGFNGCGKSSLIKVLLKDMTPDEGHVRLGKNLTPLYFDQQRETLDPHETLWQTLAGNTDQVMVQDRPRHVVSYLKDFLFDADQARSPVSSLSGGEKSRLLLAKYFAKPSNFLILDEPTNDLDMDTIDLLTDVLSDFQGTLLIISHDRDFLDQLVTSTFVFSPHGLIEVAGGYTDAIPYIEPSPKPLKAKAKEISKPPAKDMAGETKNQRLSFHETRLLTVLPQDISELEKRKDHIITLLAQDDLYAKEPKIFQELTDEYQLIQKSIEDKEQQWLDLEAKRQMIEK